MDCNCCDLHGIHLKFGIIRVARTMIASVFIAKKKKGKAGRRVAG